MSIFELDVTSEQAKGMLGILAQIGSIAYPPASPVLGVLNWVGQAILSSDQDDTEFRYTMVLDPKGGFDHLKHLTLEAGNYILVRSKDRTTPIQWNELVLDENEGRLYKTSAAGEVLYTENTYVVVEVNKNTSSVEVDLSQHTFEELLTALREEDRKRAGNLPGIITALEKVALQRSQTITFNRAKELTQRLETETVAMRSTPTHGLCSKCLLPHLTLLRSQRRRTANQHCQSPR